MTPVTQTILLRSSDPQDSGPQGNCWQAAIASMVDLDIEDVPHFIQDDVDHDTPEWNWLLKTYEWLLERDLVIADSDLSEPDTYLLVCGTSPRDSEIRHVAIYFNGEIVHDPHPDRTGLLSTETVYSIRPLEVTNGE